MKFIVTVVCCLLLLNTGFGQSISKNDSTKTLKIRRNYFGLEFLGSPLNISYGRYIITSKKIKQSIHFGITPLVLAGLPSANICYRVDFSEKKINFYSEIGFETTTLVYPIFLFDNKKIKVAGTLVDVSTHLNFGTTYNKNRLLITPLFLRLTFNSNILYEINDEPESKFYTNFISIGANVKYKF